MNVSPVQPQAGSERHQELMTAAQRWVSQTFLGTMLRQMRNSPFKSELFSGGRGGEAFATLLDQHLADRMAPRTGRALAQSIVRRIERSGRQRMPAEMKDVGSALRA